MLDTLKKLGNTLIDKLQATFPPNRIVALLSAPVAVGVAAGAAWVAAKFPGLDLDSTQITAIALGALGAVVAAAYKYLDGWQAYEAREAAAEKTAQSPHKR